MLLLIPHIYFAITQYTHLTFSLITLLLIPHNGSSITHLKFSVYQFPTRLLSTHTTHLIFSLILFLSTPHNDYPNTRHINNILLLSITHNDSPTTDLIFSLCYQFLRTRHCLRKFCLSRGFTLSFKSYFSESDENNTAIFHYFHFYWYLKKCGNP